MAGSLETGDVVCGRGCELHISPQGLALTYAGAVSSDPNKQATGYSEIATAHVASGGGSLVITFTDERPPWTVAGVLQREAQWAQDAIERAALRARLQTTPEFTKRMAPSDIASTLASWSAQGVPAPSALADFVLLQATLNGATDLHLRPDETGLTVWFRIDGQLVGAGSVPADTGARIAARMKAAAGMKTYQRNCAQTGRLSLPVGERAVDVRITALPTTHGEKLTARIFDPLAALVDVDALGIDPAPLADYQRTIGRPDGCVLFTGPAGSGKTTTMYAGLRWIADQKRRRSIATVEEPVEFELSGVDQTEVNRAVGLDFAGGLRTVLRQDPQVIMVGEIRDPETAEIAVRAGLTGHLVFSTVHAPSTAGVFARLIEMGLEPYLVASSITAVIAQRLVRRVCPDCAEAYHPTEEELREAGLGAADVTGWTLRRGRGCGQCGDSGYRGRTGLFELLTVTPSLRAAVMERRSVQEVEALAVAAGHATLWQVGLSKVRAGVTTLAEVLAVVGSPSV